MNLEDLQADNRIIYSVISGSHAYGTANEDSDVDMRGIFIHDPASYLNVFNEPEPQISDSKNDITYFSLKRAFELLSKSNPNIIELLWMPEDCIKQKTEIMDEILENKHLFISKECFTTHSGYAFAQIKKAKGSNKKVHNPQPKEQPKKEDFCWIIPKERLDPKAVNAHEYPCRPIALNEASQRYDLSKYHASSLEHSHNIFRLYYYGDSAKSIFRGDDMLVCESIPKEDEFAKFSGLLIYNKDGYEKAIKDHRSYWDWMKHRNSARWVDQEKGNLDYDQKNMTHCVRLLMSGENILRNGEPTVRFEGEKLDYLMNIRRGELDYEDIMADVQKRMALLEALKEESTIPESVDNNEIERLYKHILNSIKDKGEK